eukprot:5396027-Pyramimonas_sp.AAC.1
MTDGIWLPWLGSLSRAAIGPGSGATWPRYPQIPSVAGANVTLGVLGIRGGVACAMLPRMSQATLRSWARTL